MGAGSDNSTVKITIDIVDANSGAVVSTITKNLAGMGAAGSAAGQKIADGARTGAESLDGLGDAGSNAGKKIRQGMDDAGHHTLTNLDKVRLLRDDLGIRIPRAMENVIARSSAASAAIGAIGSGLIALGSIEIFARIAMGAYELYKRVGDVNSELQKYSVNVANSSQQTLFDTGKIETMRSLIQQTNNDMDRLARKRESAGVGENGKGSILQYGKYPAKAAESALQGAYNHVIDAVTPSQLRDVDISLGSTPATPAIYGASEQKQDVAAHERNDAAHERLRILQQQSEIEKLQGEGAAKAAALVGAAARRAKTDSEAAIAMLKRQQALSDEQYRVQQSQESIARAKREGKKDADLPTIYKPDVRAGEDEYRDSMQRIQAMGRAESTADARKQLEETLHIQAEARNAGLQGEAHYMAERDEHLRQLKEKMADTELAPIEYMKRVRAVEQQYSQERIKRLEAEHTETARMQAEGAQGGLTGMARIDAQTRTEFSSIAKEAPGFSDPATKSAREAAARQKALQEQQHEAEQFTERLAQLDDGRASSTMSANQKIDLATRHTQQEILKAWKETYGQLGAMDARRVQSYQAVQAEMVKISADGEEEKRKNRQSIEEQTLKAEAEGARRGLSRDQEQRQAILDEYNERYRALEDLRVRDADNADLYRRQEIAAEEVKNGKLIEQQREMRDKLAGQLKGFMSNPKEAMKRLGEDAASKYAADLILRSTNGGAGSAAKGGGLFDMPWGKKHGDAHPAAVSSSGNVSAATTTVSATNATIHVRQATFTGAGGGSAASYGGSGGSGTFSPGAGPLASLPGATGSSIPGAAGGWTGSGSGDLGGGLSGGGDLGGGFTSTGGPGIAAARSSMGMTDAGSMPQTLMGGAQSIMGMGKSADSLGKELFKDYKGIDVSKMTGISSAQLGKAGGAAGGAMGLFSAYEGNGGVGGAFSGAMAGAQLGGTYFGPIGAGVGAAAGAIIGFMGFGGASKAKQYDEKQVRPRIAGDLQQYEMGSMDYQSAYDDLNKLDMEAKQQTKQWGPGGEREYNDHIKSEIKAASDRLTREQQTGRSKFGMTGAQFHNGGLIGDFGSMGTTGDQGWIHAQRNEFVVQQQAVPSHYQGLQLIQSGASHGDMARYYGGSSPGGQTTSPARSAADVNLHFHSHDPRGTHQLFMDNKHSIREALNGSYDEDSGGAA